MTLPAPITTEIRTAYARAADWVAAKTDVPVSRLSARADLRAEVWTETLRHLGHVPDLADAFADAMLPTSCERPSCENTAPQGARWCGTACRQWGARARRRGVRA